eukprot:TRINITY_DN27236_c0_g1_i1.p1 TRINITY_DN27236_c0_g1~~TRINITY_DN27236_c0_g1_i1.p1  ORF type:complete len:400 (-),score=68.16 TRINITY_DN27236_c0_g1_i1:74-1237(-)
MVSLTDFDVFRRPPSDIHERGTAGGSALSLISAVLFLIVVVCHVSTFMFSSTKSADMVVRQFRKDKVKIVAVIDLAMPCPLVDLEVHDASGTHTLDDSRSLSKTRLSALGEVVATTEVSGIAVDTKHLQNHQLAESGRHVSDDYHRTSGHAQLDALGSNAAAALSAMVNAREWCRFNGSVVVAKLPGRLFFRAHHALLADSVGDAAGNEEWYNTSHVVHSMNFRDVAVADHQMGAFAMFDLRGILPFDIFSVRSSIASLLENLRGWKPGPMDVSRMAMTKRATNWRYDVQVVQEIDGDKEFYTYTMGNYSYQMSGSPLTEKQLEPFAMSYEFSPITVMYKVTYVSFAEFICSLLASLGGLLAIVRLVDNVVFVGRQVAVKGRSGKML